MASLSVTARYFKAVPSPPQCHRIPHHHHHLCYHTLPHGHGRKVSFCCELPPGNYCRGGISSNHAHCTLHAALHTAHCKLCKLGTVHCTYCAHCTVFTLKSVQTILCNRYTHHCKVHTAFCTCIAHCQLHTALVLTLTGLIHC